MRWRRKFSRYKQKNPEEDMEVLLGSLRKSPAPPSHTLLPKSRIGKFFVQGQKWNILGIAGQVAFVSNTQLWCYSLKVAMGKMQLDEQISEWVRWCPDKCCLQKQVAVQSLLSLALPLNLLFFPLPTTFRETWLCFSVPTLQGVLEILPRGIITDWHYWLRWV